MGPAAVLAGGAPTGPCGSCWVVGKLTIAGVGVELVETITGVSVELVETRRGFDELVIASELVRVSSI